MVETTLLLAPVVILGVVLLLGFVGCDGWPGVGGSGGTSGTGQSQLTLNAKAPDPGPGVTAITDANFAVEGPGGFATTVQATMKDPKWWQGVLPIVDMSPLGPWTITPWVQYDASEKAPDIPGPVVGANISAPFTKDWSAGATMEWSFCVKYKPENLGLQELWDLIDCT